MGPFKYDKIYVFADIALFSIFLLGMMSLMQVITDEAIKKASMGNGPNFDPAMAQNFATVFIGFMLVCCAPISIAMWIFIWKGKKWAFIVSIVLLCIFTLFQFKGLGGNPQADQLMDGRNGLSHLGVFGMAFLKGFPIFIIVSCFGKLGYLICRIIGKVGPALS